MKRTILTAFAAVFLAVLAAPAYAGAHCDRHPGDFLGTDGRCHLAGSHEPHAYGDRHHHRDWRHYRHARHHRHHRFSTVTAYPVVPTPGAGPTEEDRRAFKVFTDRCELQARKRAEIHGVPVTPAITGDINGVAKCHIPAMVSEHGAI